MAKSTLHRNGWISVPVDPLFEAKAMEMRRERDAKYGNIFQEKDSDLRWVGDLGEMVFKSWLKHGGITDFEWILDDVSGKPDFQLSNGHRIGVKTVKRKDAPKANYEAGMTARHTLEPVDSFFFLSYEFPTRTMWLIGGIGKAEFVDKSRHFKAGDYVHPNYCIRPGHEINNIEMQKLTSPSQWLMGVVSRQAHAA